MMRGLLLMKVPERDLALIISFSSRGAVGSLL
jgi:hypothetical protein